MPIPDNMLSHGINEPKAYVNYVTKYPHAQSGTPTPRKSQGKGLMRRSDMEVNPPKSKKQKDAVLIKEKLNEEAKKRHVEIVLERQVNKEVAKGYQHLKIKLKAKEQPSPEAQLLLNLKIQSKESKKQSILEEIQRKALRKGSGAAPESPDHSDSFESSNDDKT
nr:hypothetical protein [Tanacetum cinerariifolium]